MVTSGEATQLLISADELRTLRMAVEASGEVIFMTDNAGTITYVNPEFVRLYGYTPADVVGRATPRVLKGAGTSREEYDEFWNRLAQSEVVRREFVNRTKAGDLLIVESSANPIVRDDVRVGYLAVQRDITARKGTEAALRDSEMRYRALAEAAHDSIFIVDRDARVTYANAASCERFGHPSAEVIGKRIDEVFPEAAADEMWRQVSAVFEAGRRESFETSFLTAAGEQWLETSLVPMASRGSPPMAVMGVARDVTGRKVLERQLLQAQKMEAIGQLAGGIAHDFNNVLTAILGYSELLLDRVGDVPDLVEDIGEIRKAGDRAARLTKQLLAFGRRQMIAPRVVDLNDVLTDLERMLVRIIGEDVRLTVALAPMLDHARVDPSQIEQVIVNLAVNARDAMPRGGMLCVTSENVDVAPAFASRNPGLTPGRYVALTVRDTGCGMSPDVLSHVFEPFFTTKPIGKGTGLGLAMVYGIVKQSGGYVRIESVPGEGTTVTIYLPSVGDVALAEPSATEVTPRCNGTETILLVEDDPGVRQLMQRTLAGCGYTVFAASTATEAVAFATVTTSPLELLLSDVIMPDLSGPDVAQRVVRRHPQMKVLYVSGFISESVLGSGTLSRHAAFLPKPFTAHALCMKVRECLDTPS